MVANATNEENLKILRMIEEGRITAEQGAQLLGSGSKAAETAVTAPASTPDPTPVHKTGKAKFFRVLITDTNSGKVRTSVTLPLTLVKWGLKVGGRFAPEVEGLDFDELNDILQNETAGKLVEVVDEDDGEHVQIFIE
jgi:hypothetical protein